MCWGRRWAYLGSLTTECPHYHLAPYFQCMAVFSILSKPMYNHSSPKQYINTNQCTFIYDVVHSNGVQLSGPMEAHLECMDSSVIWTLHFIQTTKDENKNYCSILLTLYGYSTLGHKHQIWAFTPPVRDGRTMNTDQTTKGKHHPDSNDDCCKYFSMPPNVSTLYIATAIPLSQHFLAGSIRCRKQPFLTDSSTPLLISGGSHRNRITVLVTPSHSTITFASVVQIIMLSIAFKISPWMIYKRTCRHCSNVNPYKGRHDCCL